MLERRGPQRSGLKRHDGIGGSRCPVDHHPIMQPRDRLATRTDEQSRDQPVYEACQRSAEQRNPESESVALMLQIGLSHRSRVVDEKAGEHRSPLLITNRNKDSPGRIEYLLHLD